MISRSSLTRAHISWGRIGHVGENELRVWTGQLPAPVGLRDDGRQSEEQGKLPRFDHNTRRRQSAEAVSALRELNRPCNRSDKERMGRQPVIHASTWGDLKARFPEQLRDSAQTPRKATVGPARLAWSAAPVSPGIEPCSFRGMTRSRPATALN